MTASTDADLAALRTAVEGQRAASAAYAGYVNETRTRDRHAAELHAALVAWNGAVIREAGRAVDDTEQGS